MAALEALYAGLPGGLVMPCLLPVIMKAVGWCWERRLGRKVVMPFMAPKRLTSKIWGGLVWLVSDEMSCEGWERGYVAKV